MAVRKVSAKKADESVKTQREITFSDKLWEKIKDLDIEIFALPNQTLKDHVERAEVLPDQLHLIMKAPAMIAVLEEVMRKQGPKLGLLGEHEGFEVIQTPRFAIIKVVPKDI